MRLECQHQCSLAPVINYFLLLLCPMVSRDGWGLSFPNVCLTVEETPEKNLNRESDTFGDRTVPIRWKTRMLSLDTRGIKISIIILYLWIGGEGWMGFKDLWSGQKPWWNWYLTTLVNFVRSGGPSWPNPLSSPPQWGPWDLFRSFKICSDAK